MTNQSTTNLSTVNLEQKLQETKPFHKILLVYMALSLPAIPVLGHYFEQSRAADYCGALLKDKPVAEAFKITDYKMKEYCLAYLENSISKSKP